MKWNPFSRRHSSKPDSDPPAAAMEKEPPETTDSDLENGLGYQKPSSHRPPREPKPYRVPSSVPVPPPPSNLPLPSPNRRTSGLLPPPSTRRVSPSYSLQPPPSRRTSRNSRSYHGHSRRPSKSTSPYRPTTSPDADPDILPIRQPTVTQNQPLPPTNYFTPHQIVYLFVVSSFLPLIVSGVINFGIAYGLYRNYQNAKITLWAFPSTLAGDAAVTVVLTCITTWFIEYFLVRRDIATGGVAPFGWIDEPESKCLRWFLFLSKDEDEGEEGGLGEDWGEWLIGQVMRVGVLTMGCMMVFWPATVGILIAVGKREGNDWVYEQRWTPELFKLVLGGAMGAIVTPVMASVWLVRGGLRSG